MTKFYNMEGESFEVSVGDTKMVELWDIANRSVAQERVGQYDVSTVCLVIDHNYTGVGPPVIFETMIFGDGLDEEYCERYTTKEEAIEGHARAVEFARNRDRVTIAEDPY